MRGLILQTPYYSLRGSHNNRIIQGAHTILEVLNMYGIDTWLLNMDAKSSDYGTRYQILNSTNSSVDDEFIGYDYTKLKDVLNGKWDFIIVTCGDVIVPTVDTGSPKHTQIVVDKLREFGYKGRIIGYGAFLTHINGIDIHIYGDAEDKICEIVNSPILGTLEVETPEYWLNFIPHLTTNKLIIPINPIELDSISSSRGCIGKCKFCIVPGIYHGKTRFVNPKIFAEQIKYRIDNYGVKNFYFTDLLFTTRPSHVNEICSLIKDLGITWRCEARVDTLNTNMLKNMYEAGCEYIKLGIESMNDDRLKWMNKRITVTQIQKAVKKVQDSGIKVVSYILLGGEGFSTDDYMKELELFKELKCDKYTVSILNPTIGSEFYNEIAWAKDVHDGVSHLDSNIANRWGIEKKVVDAFFNMELSHRREDEKIRKYEK